MRLSRRTLSDFFVRVRYFARFHSWPRSTAIARLNLRYGREIYHNGGVGTISFYPEDARVITVDTPIEPGFVYMDSSGKVVNAPKGNAIPIGVVTASETLQDGRQRVVMVTRAR